VSHAGTVLLGGVVHQLGLSAGFGEAADPLRRRRVGMILTRC